MTDNRGFNKNELLRGVPSVDDLIRSDAGANLVNIFGRPLFVSTIQKVITLVKTKTPIVQADLSSENILTEVSRRLNLRMEPKLRGVINLTGTVLHTNLGRAILPWEAVELVSSTMSQPVNLEFDLGKGRRGDRDKLVEDWLCDLTGAEAVTVVNNNAAAVFLVLSTLGYRKDVLVSRGELVEIGGEFRIPDIMKRAGAKLLEVGTTNRTHLYDFQTALSSRTGLIMKVHASNYLVTGFTSNVREKELSSLADENRIPFAVDLGSGSLVDFSRYGLPKEQTVSEALDNGAHLVTFSCDKLLGGPQCGVIVGRRDLIAKVKKNPLKRVLRVDKMTLAALLAVLRLYSNPDTVVNRLPTLWALTRSQTDIRDMVSQIFPIIKNALSGIAEVQIIDCKSQIGSGAFPVDLLPSSGFKIIPIKNGDKWVKKIMATFRQVPVPVIGRISDGTIIFDLRCLEQKDVFVNQIEEFKKKFS